MLAQDAGGGNAAVVVDDKYDEGASRGMLQADKEYEAAGRATRLMIVFSREALNPRSGRVIGRGPII